MSIGPGIRAGWSKLAIHHVKRLPAADATAILAAVEPIRLRAREASFRDFLELDDFVTLADATLAQLGPLRTRDLWKSVMAEALLQPAIGELVRRAGPDNAEVGPLLLRTQDAFNFVHRHCGRWIVEAQQTTALVTFEAVPRLVFESRAMPLVYSGNLQAAVEHMNRYPRVVVHAEPDERALRFRVRW